MQPFSNQYNATFPAMQFPPTEVALALPPPELAGYLLMEFLRLWRKDKRSRDFGHLVPHDTRKNEETRLAYTEAWMWLIREGLALPDTDPALLMGSHSYVPSRRARSLSSLADFEAMRASRLLPREILHPLILLEVETDYFKGRYDNAVLNAFRRVEIAVREKAMLSDKVVGVRLMRTAFDCDEGPLRHRADDEGERQGMGHLFAGAFGVYGNSTRHREVGLEASESVELFVLASHLMRIVERERPS